MNCPTCGTNKPHEEHMEPITNEHKKAIISILLKDDNLEKIRKHAIDTEVQL